MPPHVAQICLFLLTESRHFPARLIQTSPPRRLRSADPGTLRIIDLDLSKYDRLASRFARERKEAASILKSGIETRVGFVELATSPEATWERNFRDLNGAVTRMCTVATGGRVTVEVVEEEIERLRRSWSIPSSGPGNDDLLNEILGPEAVARLDLFDRTQLANILGIVRGETLAVRGRAQFVRELQGKETKLQRCRPLGKYLARFGISWESVRERSRRS